MTFSDISANIIPFHMETGVVCFMVISNSVGDISSHSNGIVSQMVFALFAKLFFPTLFLLHVVYIVLIQIKHQKVWSDLLEENSKWVFTYQQIFGGKRSMLWHSSEIDFLIWRWSELLQSLEFIISFEWMWIW